MKILIKLDGEFYKPNNFNKEDESKLKYKKKNENVQKNNNQATQKCSICNRTNHKESCWFKKKNMNKVVNQVQDLNESNLIEEEFNLLKINLEESPDSSWLLDCPNQMHQLVKIKCVVEDKLNCEAVYDTGVNCTLCVILKY